MNTNRNSEAYSGQDKITRVTPEVFLDTAHDIMTGTYYEYDAFAVVWVETEFDIFMVNIPRGESPESVAAKYENRGVTDNGCIFYASKS